MESAACKSLLLWIICVGKKGHQGGLWKGAWGRNGGMKDSAWWPFFYHLSGSWQERTQAGRSWRDCVCKDSVGQRCPLVPTGKAGEQEVLGKRNMPPSWCGRCKTPWRLDNQAGFWGIVNTLILGESNSQTCYCCCLTCRFFFNCESECFWRQIRVSVINIVKLVVTGRNGQRGALRHQEGPHERTHVY